MAITTNNLDILGVAAEPILAEVLFTNNTLNKGLVTFETDVKAETIFTEASATATMQQYTSGSPTSDGDLSSWDAKVTPEKVMFYNEFDPEKLRFSRFKRDMPAGAWNNFSNEFERVVIGGIYGRKVSLSAEINFWLSAKSATLTSIAALTAGTDQDEISTAEQAMAAASLGADGQFDGLLTKILYNDSRASGTAGLGERVKVVGTTITASNIKDEYGKLFKGIPAEILQDGGEKPTIYVPYSHQQLIAEYNGIPTNYKTGFGDNGMSYSYNNLNIEYAPLPENVMLCARKSHLFWVTDLTSDVNRVKMDYMANNRDDMFLKHVMSIGAHVGNQKFNVLYVG